MMMMGASQNFFRSRIKSHNSPRKPVICCSSLEGFQHMVCGSGLFDYAIAVGLGVIAKLQWSFT